ncbi:MAG: hypothetical protein CBD88_07030 [Flavobacteriales bacterium TMED228]|nr:MAG: hypothetical protein CBD88_07030 [Flavobacteriales bacterium TMED228]|tara:strand:- start:2887 stop:3159 length:273 start_codon:yes stop_codon:yes gene_type:complete
MSHTGNDNKAERDFEVAQEDTAQVIADLQAEISSWKDAYVAAMNAVEDLVKRLNEQAEKAQENWLPIPRNVLCLWAKREKERDESVRMDQ